MALTSREHLKRISDWAEHYLRDYGDDYELHNQLCDYLKSALAAPPLNCEIGTPEEQVMRLDKFCHAQRMDGFECQCPCYANGCCNHLVWAQMPYAPVDCPPSHVPDQEGKQGGEPCALTNQ